LLKRFALSRIFGSECLNPLKRASKSPSSTPEQKLCTVDVPCQLPVGPPLELGKYV
jgi:hypothetical protein